MRRCRSTRERPWPASGRSPWATVGALVEAGTDGDGIVSDSDVQDQSKYQWRPKSVAASAPMAGARLSISAGQ